MIVDNQLVADDVEQHEKRRCLARRALLVAERELGLQPADADVIRRVIRHIRDIDAPVLVGVHRGELVRVDHAVVVRVQLLEELIHGLGLDTWRGARGGAR